MAGNLIGLSEDMAAAVGDGAGSIVRVDARRRISASGIVWSADGTIVTAHHVVRREDDITVGLPDGATVPAELVGGDPTTDLAVLRVEADGLAAATWAEPDALSVGQLVLAVGRPGDRPQASLGVISALGGRWRTHGGGHVEHFIRPDLVMYPGFSGGGLVASDGALIGLNTSALLRDGPATLAEPTLAHVVTTLLEHGRMPRAYLGVGVQPAALPERLAERMGQQTGLLVTAVEADSPAETGGIVLGDVIVALDDVATSHHDALSAELRGHRIGQTVGLRLVRGGQPTTVEVTLGERG